jgi:hypothetical protein
MAPAFAGVAEFRYGSIGPASTSESSEWQNPIRATALAMPAASAMPEAATHAMGETGTTGAMGETYAMIESATHAMAEFAVPAIVRSIGAVG